MRLSKIIRLSVSNWFQSTHPHGVRLIQRMRKTNDEEVSIHAPTRGATYVPESLCRLLSCFNPRTHTGCDFLLIIAFIIYPGFNPRTHTGCDCNIRWHLLFFKFQSTHPHGVRQVAGLKTERTGVFQSTHPHGVRLRQYLCRQSILSVSIHAPTRGATLVPNSYRPKNKFQSTHPHGVRRRRYCRH